MQTPESITVSSDLEELPRVESYLFALHKKYSIDDDIFSDIMLAVVEGVTNAMIHGNKMDREKMVTITSQHKADSISFKVIDSGEGFDPESLPSPIDDENLLKTGGRGVFLMRHYADQVTFNPKGNEITLTFNL